MLILGVALGLILGILVGGKIENLVSVRLRWMGLLAMKPGRNIGDIRDNLRGDLSDYVYLTPNGEEWVEVLARRTND